MVAWLPDAARGREAPSEPFNFLLLSRPPLSRKLAAVFSSMDKETIALIIAHNGLSTAATLLQAKATRLAARAEKAKDPGDASKLSKDAKKAKKLAAALSAADLGLAAYLEEADA